ncbi:DUF134 domain-containing protein [Dysosmobacter sp. Sow4_B12]|uniref:DUF134 domain-containing protein n=1 Tax=Dysosmobacter sp. Sow4_B12 TaxID=3438777 RepID=UPI003F8E8B45
MPRPKKCRRVCDYPQTLTFLPEDHKNREQVVILTVDEYETIRLIDKEGLSQEQCGDFMQVARTTVQQIYASARKKLADMLVNGLPLRIEGGDYQLCNGGNRAFGCSNCYKQKFNQQYAKPKGEHIMRIAVTYENGEIFQHFGHTEQFKVYDVENGKIVSSEVVDTNGSGHGALAGVLSALHVDALICGGIGGGAQAALAAAGIQLYGGVSGDADQAAEALAAGTLAYNPNVMCSHHGEHHHEGNCGDHGCGHHSCG